MRFWPQNRKNSSGFNKLQKVLKQAQGMLIQKTRVNA